MTKPPQRIEALLSVIVDASDAFGLVMSFVTLASSPMRDLTNPSAWSASQK
jgi:hypothetical protein